MQFHIFKKKIALKDCLWVGIILFLFIMICNLSNINKSLTYDELVYITSANVYIMTNDYNINNEHPPLIKQLFSIPHIILKPYVPLQSQYLKDKYQWTFGKEFLFGSGNDADSIIFWTRFVNILIGVLLGISIYFFAFKLFGKKSAYIALCFFVLSPTIIAHTSLATLDIGSSLFILLTIFAFWSFLNKPSIKKYFLFLTIFALALLTKNTSLLLVPIFSIIYIVLRIKGETKNFDNWFRLTISRLNRIIAISISYIFLISLVFITLIIWTDYGFETGRLNHLMLSKEAIRVIKDNIDHGASQYLQKALYFLTDHIPIVPNYWYSLNYQFCHSMRGHKNFKNYFLGKNDSKGSIWYLPVAFFIKTPIPILLLFFLSFFLLPKKSKETIFVFTPILFLFLFFSFINKIMIGVRYLLPAYPFIFIMIGGSVDMMIKKGKIFKILISLLGLWLIVSHFLIFPHYLAYFNESIGGPDHGYKYLADSNIDWGQDLILLKKFLEKNKLSNILISYWGNDSLHYRNLSQYNVMYNRFSKKYCTIDQELTLKEFMDMKPHLFISLNNIYIRDHWIFLRNQKPTDKIGYSIFHFDFNQMTDI